MSFIWNKVEDLECFWGRNREGMQISSFHTHSHSYDLLLAIDFTIIHVLILMK